MFVTCDCVSSINVIFLVVLICVLTFTNKLNFSGAELLRSGWVRYKCIFKKLVCVLRSENVHNELHIPAYYFKNNLYSYNVSVQACTVHSMAYGA